MRISTLVLLTLLLAQLCFSCQRDADVVEPINDEAPNASSPLFSTDGWFYSSQKDPSGALICRPNRQEFWKLETVRPYGAFTGFRFYSDGTFLGWGSGPADGIEYYPGTWAAENKAPFRVTPNDKTRPVYRLQLLSATSDQLLVKPL